MSEVSLYSFHAHDFAGVRVHQMNQVLSMKAIHGYLAYKKPPPACPNGFVPDSGFTPEDEQWFKGFRTFQFKTIISTRVLKKCGAWSISARP